MDEVYVVFDTAPFRALRQRLSVRTPDCSYRVTSTSGGDADPKLWTVYHPKDPKAIIAKPRPLSGVEQRWFVGAHANVGGGYATDLLNQAPLRWLMNKAETLGLAFRSEIELDGGSVTAPVTDP